MTAEVGGARRMDLGIEVNNSSKPTQVEGRRQRSRTDLSERMPEARKLVVHSLVNLYNGKGFKR